MPHENLFIIKFFTISSHIFLGWLLILLPCQVCKYMIFKSQMILRHQLSIDKNLERKMPPYRFENVEKDL